MNSRMNSQTDNALLYAHRDCAVSFADRAGDAADEQCTGALRHAHWQRNRLDRSGCGRRDRHHHGKRWANCANGVTGANGSYDFPTVQAGTYSVKVSKSGFKTMTKEGIAVTLNNVTRADISVEVGQVTETVLVTAETAQIKTDRAEVSAELTSRPLRDLPVPLGRNYQNLFKTLPGFTPPADAHSVPSNPSRSLVFNVNGASRSSNNTRIDGVSSTNIWLPHVTAYIPALEAIETVNVVTNSFDAEQGLAGGAAINVQIRSGTNDFHGSAFEYHSNQALKARDYFRPPSQPKGKFIQNQYGGTIGGPIKRDKLFFFFSYEGTKNRQNDSLIDSVPTATIRTGDFRNLFDNQNRPIGTQYNGFAAFLLGLPDRIGKLNLTVAPYATRNWQFSFYGRDQWQVNSKLTLSLGTRWEYLPIPTRDDRGLERYNLNTNMVEIGGVGAVPEDLGIEVSKRMFAPRIGLAYRITPKFVVRARWRLRPTIPMLWLDRCGLTIRSCST